MQDTRDQEQQLIDMMVDARKRTLELIGDLDEEQMLGPQLRIVNPPLWEIGHLAWFQEQWNLRRITNEEFAPSKILSNTDDLYDSMKVARDIRWDLPLVERVGTLEYMQRVLDET
ncbi:MAG TPA: DinB family protein, partial [Rubrobacteraceae bacterium]|nr:DinB family protein [Rubrobacteraceae bacterium]